jgi:hypothetical protein
VLATEQSHFYWNQSGKKSREKEYDHYIRFCPIAISNLNYLCANVSDLNIVISSAWRTFVEFEVIKEFLVEDGFMFVDRILGITPIRSLRSSDRRYLEIQSWLEEHSDLKIKDWVAVDDHEFTIPKEHLVLTAQEVGLDIDKVYSIIKRFRPEWERPIFLM